MQEDRIANLERKVASLELRRLYDERKAEEQTPSVQAFNLREINENMTILLGIVSGQEEDIKAVRVDVTTIKEDVSDIKRQVASLEEKFERRLTSLEGKFERRLTSLEGKLEQALQILTNLPGTNK